MSKPTFVIGLLLALFSIHSAQAQPLRLSNFCYSTVVPGTKNVILSMVFQSSQSLSELEAAFTANQKQNGVDVQFTCVVDPASQVLQAKWTNMMNSLSMRGFNIVGVQIRPSH